MQLLQTFRGYRRHALWPLACALAFCGTAFAADQVQIALVGEIERTCGVSGGIAAVDLGDVTAISRRDLTLGVTCNTPFQYTLVSANGGLRHSGTLTRIGAFADLLPYRVDVVVPTDTGRASFACDSAAMVESARRCAPADSGDGIALGRTAALSLSWQLPPLPMIAGRFEDALTISFSVKP